MTNARVPAVTQRVIALCRRHVVAIIVPACVAGCQALAPHVDDAAGAWSYYGGDAGGSRYSPLSEIDKGNVAKLAVAWEYHTGDVSDGGRDGRPKSEFETTPILFGDTLYFSTPFNRVVALDAESGREKWTFDPRVDLRVHYSEGLLNRGVTPWTDPARADGASCRRRIFIATIDARLIALDAANGAPCRDFGRGGEVDLTRDIAHIERRGEFEETSAPAIAGDLVIVGSAIADNDRVDSPQGTVRAFDARTGAMRWRFDPLPHDLAPTGAGNAWSAISVDERRDLVFVPTGSASPDYHGLKRPGDDRWADSIVALSAKTGKLVWGFQLVHHDLWDYDAAAQPLLATLARDGQKPIPVVVQASKTGYLFVLNRATGEPVFGVEERAVPASDAEGERASPTQPFPIAPPALARSRLSVDDAWGMTAEDRDACRARIARLRSEGLFTPPSVGGTIAFPGNLGGMNWSSGAFDPKRQIYVTNVNNLPIEVHLIPRNAYTRTEHEAQAGAFRAEVSPQHGTPYGMSREVLRSPSGLPCNAPPWGELVAVDLSAGTVRWRTPLGTTADLLPNVVPALRGTPNLGGPIVTASGLVFIASAMDGYLRAFDVETGVLLWKHKLPAGGQATPMTYRVHPGGRQFVVIAAGGHGKLGTKLGDSLVAYALP